MAQQKKKVAKLMQIWNQTPEEKEEKKDKCRKKDKMSLNDAILNVLKNYVKSSRGILFEGDGYSQEWEKEAKKRGLSNNKTTPETPKRLYLMTSA